MAVRDHTLSLEHRVLTYTTQGRADGHPVFYCHGNPGSRREPVLPEGLLCRCPLRLISADRPGYGGSSPCEGYDGAALAADIAALAEHLGIRKFSLAGFSGGGVFALAAATVLGKRVRRLVLVATPAGPLLDDPLADAGELNGSFWQQARDDPAALPAQFEPLTGDGDTLTHTMLAGLDDSDRALFSGASNRERYHDNMTTAVAQGAGVVSRAMARDMAFMAQPWGFDPAALSLPVDIFQGVRDCLVTPRHARVLEEIIPGAGVEWIPDGGHYAGIYGPSASAVWSRTVPAEYKAD